MEVPLIEIHLKTNKINSLVLCGMIEELPEGVDFLLGIDIACITDKVKLPLAQSVVTRAQAAAAPLQAAVAQHAGSINNAETLHTAAAAEAAGQLHTKTVMGNIDLDAVQDRAKLITQQQHDENLIDFPIGKPYYYLKDGGLMYRDIVRKTRQEAEQVVIPHSLRNKILEMAHDIPASGHLCIHKTKARLWPHFY